LTEQLRHVDWPAIRDRIFGRIDAISDGGEQYRRDHEDNANLTLLRGTARFVGPKLLQVTGNDGSQQRISADTIVLGAGSRPVLPPSDRETEAAAHSARTHLRTQRLPAVRAAASACPSMGGSTDTSDTIMRIDRLPASLAILGSGVIAVEMAHIFAS